MAYHTNRPPWNKGVWFHVVGDDAWVSFAAVRADLTILDPTVLDPDGGRPVTLDPECDGIIRDPAGGR